MTLTDLSALTDEQLVASLRDLLAQDHRLTAAVVAHLAEVEARQLHLAAACSSMFDYCTRVLGLEEGAAYNRIQVARLVRRFPLVLDMLQDGRLHLTGARLLGPQLTEDGHRELLEAAQYQSRRAIERLLAERHPKPDAPTVIRELPTPTRRQSSPQLALEAASSREGRRREPRRPAVPAPSRRPSERAEPTAPDRYKVQFTASAALVARIDEVKALLSHREPGCELATVVERAVELLRAQLLRERFGVGARPRTEKPEPDEERPRTRHVPRSVRREVIARDGLRCAYVDPQTGRRCAATTRLELQHHLPFAWGGRHEVSNTSLYCKSHNRYAAERDFGRQHIAAAIEARRGAAAAAPHSDP
jgi:hypothetical protein